MEHVSTSLLFSKWALESLMLPPLAVAFALSAISLLWAGIKQRPFHTQLWRPYHWLVISHLLFFMAAIAVGVFGANLGAGQTSFAAEGRAGLRHDEIGIDHPQRKAIHGGEVVPETGLKLEFCHAYL